jgi:hypothetical protein
MTANTFIWLVFYSFWAQFDFIRDCVELALGVEVRFNWFSREVQYFISVDGRMVFMAPKSCLLVSSLLWDALILFFVVRRASKPKPSAALDI